MYPIQTDDEATVIDRGPHWSAAPLTTLPPPVQRSAVQPVQPYMLPRTFYSYAEEQSAQALDTECVAPLPMSELRPDWQIWVAAQWARYAVPVCGVVAGLLLVIGYLALGGEPRAVAASAGGPQGAIVMRVDGPAPTARDAAIRKAIALARAGRTSTTDMADIEEAATTGTVAIEQPTAVAIAELPATDEVSDASDEIEMEPAVMAAPVKHAKRAAKRVAAKSVKATKRGPIKLNAKTALGDLRPGRTR